jgi:hypothetical protein
MLKPIHCRLSSAFTIGRYACAYATAVFRRAHSLPVHSAAFRRELYFPITICAENQAPMKPIGHRDSSQGAAAHNHHRFKTHSRFVPTRRGFLHHAVSKPPRPRLRVALQPYPHVAAALPIQSETISVGFCRPPFPTSRKDRRPETKPWA